MNPVPMISSATAAVSALTVLAERATIVSSAANVKTVSKWYAAAATDAQIVPSFAPNAEKSAKPALMTSFVTAAVYAGIV